MLNIFLENILHRIARKTRQVYSYLRLKGNLMLAKDAFRRKEIPKHKSLQEYFNLGRALRSPHSTK